MKKILLFALPWFFAFFFAGCGVVGQKNISLSMVYAVCALMSLLTLIAYSCLIRMWDKWFLLMFVSVLVVNLGYFALSTSHSLQGALWANRFTYLGSVFLPLAMLMIILDVTKIKYKHWFPVALVCLSVLVFLIAGSPGYSDIYYKEVYLEIMDGISVLKKVYGPWHSLYLFYLIGYFSAMIGIIVRAFIKKTTDSTIHSVFIAIAVFVNLAVWFLEQLVNINLEFLSVSYIISELFLLGLHFVMKEHQKLKELVKVKEIVADFDPKQDKVIQSTPLVVSIMDKERFECFITGYKELTKTEKAIFDGYVSRLTTKEIMVSLNIKENTLKFHNKNIYGKLGVSSRRELLELYTQINATKFGLGE